MGYTNLEIQKLETVDLKGWGGGYIFSLHHNEFGFPGMR